VGIVALGEVMSTEEKRILKAYERRADRKKVNSRFFCYNSLFHLYEKQERHRETLRLLERFSYTQLTDLRVLDVGCGNGNMLRQFLQWGALPENLAGIDLRQEQIAHARHYNPNIDTRCGSAVDLPWPDHSFELACLNTVFTSIMDVEMKRRIVAELVRVLQEGGAVLWYDFMYNNPWNPDVKGVKSAEINMLFSGFDIHLHRITLAPPLGRVLPSNLLPILYPLLAAIPWLRSHYLGLLFKPKH
jgi:SAM-dependent methyltransferase